jgi:hypothetical protein
MFKFMEVKMSFKRLFVFILISSFLAPFFAVSQWEPISGLPNVPIKDILTYKDKVYLAAEGVGIYVSSDNGDNWDQLNNGITTNRVSCIAVVDTVLLVGTTDTNGVFRSTDKGYHWKRSSDSLWDRKVVMFSVDGNIVYLLTEVGTIFYSTDYGQIWWQIKTAEIESLVTCIAASNGKLLAGTSSGQILLTEDKGNTWLDIGTKLIFSPINSLLWDSENIYCGTEMGLFFSSNMGKDWFQRNSGIKNPRISLIRKVNNVLVAGTRSVGIFFSLNQGQSWIDFNEGIPEMSIISLANDKFYIYAGTEFGSFARRPLNQMRPPDVQPPVLTYPANGATGIDTSITFSWGEAKGSIAYRLLIATDNSFAQNKIVLDKSNILNTYFPVTILRPNRVYYWKVAAIDYEYNEKWSEVFSFQTRLDTVAPTLLFPFNDFTVESFPIQFIWSDLGIVKDYNLQVSRINDFTDLVIDAHTKDTFYLATEGFQNSQKYYWRVTVAYNDDLSLTSDTFMFRTGILGVEGQTDTFVKFIQTESQVQFLIKVDNYQIVELEVLNLFGQPVLFGFYEATPNDYLISIDNKNLTSGFYYFILKVGTQTYSSPFVIVK